MKYGYMVTGALLVFVIDLLFYVYVDEWSDVYKATLFSINLVLIIGVAAIALSPKGANSDIFRLSADLISLFFLIIEVLLACITIYIGLDLSAAVMFQSILIVFFVVILVLNGLINRDSARADACTYEGRMQIGQIKDILYGAMDACEERSMKVDVEKAYDAVSSMTGISSREMDTYNQDLLRLAMKVEAAVNEHNGAEVRELCVSILSTVQRREQILRRM